MCDVSPVNMKHKAPQVFRALTTVVTNIFTDLFYKTVCWMQHLRNKQTDNSKPSTTKRPPKPPNPNKKPRTQ